MGDWISSWQWRRAPNVHADCGFVDATGMELRAVIPTIGRCVRALFGGALAYLANQ
jgi:hypothetical protein